MPRYRISWVTGGLILGLTLVLDGAQLLLTATVVGSLLSMALGLLAGFALWLTFVLHGVRYTGAGGLKKVGTLVISMLVEFIPVIDVLPAVTVGALLTILTARKEDRTAFAQEQEDARKRAHALEAAQQRAANDNAQRIALQEAA